MGHPVIAIGLDSAEPTLIERWTAEGKLPTLARLKAQGVYGRVEGAEFNPSEVCWSTFLTGCWPQKTGFWQVIRFDASDYGITRGAYDYDGLPPFYALGEPYKVAAFDMPYVPLSDDVNGLQVVAWGSHSGYTKPGSRPADLLSSLQRQYGNHPAFNRDHARMWRKGSMRRLQERVLQGIARRGEICRDLLQRDRWDLFLAAFSETHSCPHYTWHHSQPDHPLHNGYKSVLNADDPVLELYQEVDKALGRLLEAVPADAQVVVYSQLGMEPCSPDVPNMAVLPEFTYRFCFPGRVGLSAGAGGPNTPPPPVPFSPANLGWVRSVWAMKSDPNPVRRFIRKHLVMELGHQVERLLGEAPGPQYPYRFDPYFTPAMWFSPYWPEMRAFALPALGSHGQIRVNLRGRERNGIVAPEDYEALCDELCDHLSALRDPRSGKAVVRELTRPRSGHSMTENGGLLGDVVVEWDDSTMYDVIDSPQLGRIGPFSPRRSSGHNRFGFFMASGPGVPAASQVADTKLVDLAPMILDFMGAPIPGHMDGTLPFQRS